MTSNQVETAARDIAGILDRHGVWTHVQPADYGAAFSPITGNIVSFVVEAPSGERFTVAIRAGEWNMPKQTVDDVITAITEAPTEADAVTIMRMQSRAMVLAVADQLYVDPGASLAIIRREIVAEARS